MKVKLFGKDLFEIKKNSAEVVFNTALEKHQKSEYLIDFYRDTGNSRSNDIMRLEDYVIATPQEVGLSGSGTVAIPIKGKKASKPKKEIKLTPKGVFHLKLLNDEKFTVKTDSKYVDEQIEQIKDKLSMIKTVEYDMNYGTTELGSILARLENRKKYPEFEKYYEQFPYTTNIKISELIKNHSHLKLGQVEQFIADMPKEAVDVMKEYTKQTKSLCGKKPIFYIIADQKDFKKTESRRDPILLAQSPFGHFWQILGAWDEEMILVDEL